MIHQLSSSFNCNHHSSVVIISCHRHSDDSHCHDSAVIISDSHNFSLSWFSCDTHCHDSLWFSLSSSVVIRTIMIHCDDQLQHWSDDSLWWLIEPLCCHARTIQCQAMSIHQVRQVFVECSRCALSDSLHVGRLGWLSSSRCFFLLALNALWRPRGQRAKQDRWF